jgi:four helix bundle protein
MRGHRKLFVWQKAHRSAIDVRRATSRFPRFGFGELKHQLTSAAESIAVSIAEGCGASSEREFCRCLEIAIESCSALEAELALARDYYLVPVAEYARLSTDVLETRRMLFVLRERAFDSTN